MKVFIRLMKSTVPIVVLTLSGNLLISGCSLVGIIGGASIDSTNRKKVDKISSESQEVMLRYKDGSNIRGVYKGLEYLPEDVQPENAKSDSLSPDQFVTFPKIGEDITLTLQNDTLATKGRFAGLAQSKGEYHLMLETDPEQSNDLIALKQLVNISKENGKVLSDFPEPTQIYLLYENSEGFQKVSLAELSHIHHKSTNNILTLGAFGLGIDALILISVSRSFSDRSFEW